MTVCDVYCLHSLADGATRHLGMAYVWPDAVVTLTGAVPLQSCAASMFDEDEIYNLQF